MQRDGNSGSHHVEQNLHAPGTVQPLERTREVSKRARQDPNPLPFDQVRIQARQIALGPLDQQFDHPHGNRDWSTVLMCKEVRNPDRATHGEPAVASKIEDHEQVAGEQRGLDRSQPARVSDGLPNLGKEGPKPLGPQFHSALCSHFGRV